MVVRVVASHLVIQLTRAIGSVLAVLPREKSVVVHTPAEPTCLETFPLFGADRSCLRRCWSFSV